LRLLRRQPPLPRQVEQGPRRVQAEAALVRVAAQRPQAEVARQGLPPHSRHKRFRRLPVAEAVANVAVAQYLYPLSVHRVGEACWSHGIPSHKKKSGVDRPTAQPGSIREERCRPPEISYLESVVATALWPIEPIPALF